MKKTFVAALTVATVAGSLVTATPPAKAGDGVGAGIAAGLIGGAIVGGAIASSRPAYGGPVYVAEPRRRHPATGAVSGTGTATAGSFARFASATDLIARRVRRRDRSPAEHIGRAFFGGKLRLASAPPRSSAAPLRSASNPLSAPPTSDTSQARRGFACRPCRRSCPCRARCA